MNTYRLEKMSSLDYGKKATKQYSHVLNGYAHKLCTKEVVKGDQSGAKRAGIMGVLIFCL